MNITPGPGINVNALQTYLTLAIGAMWWLLKEFGCTETVPGMLNCSASHLLNPTVAVWVTSVLIVIKLGVLPAISEGGWARNLFWPKVPVSDSGAAGTVTPFQVQPPEEPPPAVKLRPKQKK